MKQIIQNLKTGETQLVDVPCPGYNPHNLLIRTTASLVSAGTERMLLEFGKAGWLDKARQQPDKVRQVLNKIKTDGLMPTFEAVRAKLDQPLPLGYCNVGRVEEVDTAQANPDFKKGRRVVSNGPHAEVVGVPPNLCAGIPDSVTDEEAAFTVIGAIGLQGVRLVQPTLGECFVVIGLGLIGLLTVQILQANGCRVLGTDLDPAKCALARQFGAETVDLSQGEDPLSAAASFSRGRGVDGVLITAATKSNEPVHQAAQMCRQRGRIVLSGVTGLELRRDDFYKKELSFQVSCSYGPGRYDPEYEEKGHDYPLGLVRWTEQRNFEAFLDLLAEKKLDVRPLISHRFPLEEALRAYELISTGQEPYVGILLTYGSPASTSATCQESQPPARTIILAAPSEVASPSPVSTIGFIGAGGFSGLVLLPALKKTGVRLKTIASRGGLSSTHLGKKFGFEESTTEVEKIFADPQINTVFITTRHNTHARLVLQALQAGKHVFVEKPLCLKPEELQQIEAATNFQPSIDREQEGELPTADGSRQPLLMVGFNRRFAPQVQKMKALLTGVKEPKAIIMTVNAGLIPPEHWTQDPEVGGGRVLGEACHFVDLLRFLAGSPITAALPTYMQKPGPQDVLTFTLNFADGSIGMVHYLANGHKSFPKERLEVFCGGRVLQLDNFLKMRGFGWPSFKKMNLWRQDKGHLGEIEAFVAAVQGRGPNPIPLEETFEVTRITFGLASKK